MGTAAVRRPTPLGPLTRTCIPTREIAATMSVDQPSPAPRAARLRTSQRLRRTDARPNPRDVHETRRSPGSRGAQHDTARRKAGSGVLLGGVTPLVTKLCNQHRRLSPPLHTQLRQQPGHIILDRLLRQEHPLRDLPIRQPLTNQIQQSALLIRQTSQRTRPLHTRPQPVHQRRRSPIIQQRPPRPHMTNRLNQLHTPNVLDHIPTRPRQNRIRHRLLIRIRRQHQTVQPRQHRTQLPTQLHTITIRQTNIQHRHIRPQRRHPSQRLRHRTRLPNHRQVHLLVKKISHTTANNLMVIDQNHRDHMRLPASSFIHVFTLRCP
jgi:hypothetical protein